MSTEELEEQRCVSGGKKKECAGKKTQNKSRIKSSIAQQHTDRV